MAQIAGMHSVGFGRIESDGTVTPIEVATVQKVVIRGRYDPPRVIPFDMTTCESFTITIPYRLVKQYPEPNK
jgi:hypothetical protein